MRPPKAFVSYSWSSEEHKEWVLELARELRQDGVEVILDRWHLKKGQDKYAFMESMVTDEEVEKVICVCDAEYTRKAREREGGVGTESMIISPEVYESAEQTKFVAVVRDTDESGDPIVPPFFTGRLHVLMDTPERRAENYDQLLRWLLDKPVEEAPEVGEPPAYLSEDEDALDLGVRTRFRRALGAIDAGNPAIGVRSGEYLRRLASGLEQLRVEATTRLEAYEEAHDRIEQFQPYRDQYIQFVSKASRLPEELIPLRELLEFFESALSACFPNDEPSTAAISFSVQELWLYTVASFVDARRFDLLRTVLMEEYVIEQPGRSTRIYDFTILRTYNTVLIDEGKNQNSSNRVADLLTNRVESTRFFEQDVIQADILLEICSCLIADRRRWYPDTLLYARRQRLPLFERAKRAGFFHELDRLFGVGSVDALRTKLEECGMLDDRRTTSGNILPTLREVTSMDEWAIRA